MTSTGLQNSSLDGFIHGSLNTEGIAGASPALCKLRKHAANHQHAVPSSKEGLTAAAQPGATMPAPAAAAETTGWLQDVPQDPGMRPRIRIPKHMNKPDLIHSVHDIEGAQSRPHSAAHRPRGTNPNDRDYHLSSGEVVCVPLGPAAVDRLLRDPLKVSDIPGATRSIRRLRTTAAPQQLDVSDIDGAINTWRPPHRQHVGVRVRTTALNVSDINSYMARFKPAGKTSPVKGHPEGPKVASHVQPRRDPGLADNSLRTRDLEIVRALWIQQRQWPEHHFNNNVADIAGAAPAVKDKVQLFKRKRVAAAAAVAEHDAGAAVLSNIQLTPDDLAAVWSNCSKFDRDKSGYLTACELESALKSSQLQLTAEATKSLLQALKDNAGLINYKKLTRQLKSRTSRPNSAQQPQQDEKRSRDESGLQQQQQDTACNVQENLAVTAATAAAAATITTTQHLAARLEPAGANISNSSTTSVQLRPCTAPACTRAAAAAAARGHQEPAFKDTLHWFSGSSRSKVAAAEIRAWSPTRALEQTLESAVMTKLVPYPGQRVEVNIASTVAGVVGPQDRCNDQGACDDNAADNGDLKTNTKGASGTCDVVPGWVIGADAVTGTFKVVHPFQGTSAACTLDTKAAAASESPAAAAAAAAAAPAVDLCESSNNSSGSRSGDGADGAVNRPRPASAPYAVHGGRDSSTSCSRAIGFGSSSGSSIVPSSVGLSVSCSTSSREKLLPTAASTGGNDEFAQLHQHRAQAAMLKKRPASAAAAAARHGLNSFNEQCSSGATRGRGAVHGSFAAAAFASSVGGGKSLGFAEKRRFLEAIQSDLAAVRMLQ